MLGYQKPTGAGGGSAGSPGGGSGSAGAVRRHLLGIHAITSSGTLSKAAILARDWMTDVDPATCDCDIQLVGGGASGAWKYLGSSNSDSFVQGGSGAGVTTVSGILFEDFPDNAEVFIGAGGAGSAGGTGAQSNGQNVGGDTIIPGFAMAPGGGVSPPPLSDLIVGAPGFAGATIMDAAHSMGPGSGGGARGSSTAPAYGVGSNAQQNRLSVRRLGGTGEGGNGQSAAAESLGLGAGGAGANFWAAVWAGNGGFPGGGGGGKCRWASKTDGSGSGGNGVVRVAVYQWR